MTYYIKLGVLVQNTRNVSVDTLNTFTKLLSRVRLLQQNME